ncbi:phosphoribosylformylglycinamidine synthase I [Endomicrobium proavitum]|uniref:Phosphoribosylformylglycinamidine synthase subunit PurQ n=1 Tax=Endomicrobium proavitum TaxID=1408281 RepID=A0A0G3WKN1_9BACT|nr:phosphoribosylformylglycinamidine synthase I [Endomicrobium proavitum]AKL98019.1 Phosphoribosylformylglycinamidine synthase 1 [Endomicrobium proavitum]
MKKVKALILRTAGTNCDFETQAAFELCGASAEKLHVNELIEKRDKIFEYDILAFPGGFSYGDDIASGKILSNEVKNKLGEKVQKFALSGKPVIGICNGFQVLVKMGLLPDSKLFKQISTLSYNDSDKFECRWVYLKTEKQKGVSKSLWVQNLPNIISLPVAHGEGKFIPADKKLLDDLNKNNQVVFRYSSKDGKNPKYPLDPNGSTEQIAGICNAKGNVFGLMPHPERYVFALQHPGKEGFDGEHGWGKIIFQNAVDYI